MGCFSMKYTCYTPCYLCSGLFPDDSDVNFADLENGGEGKVQLCNLIRSDDEQCMDELIEYFERHVVKAKKGQRPEWGAWCEEEEQTFEGWFKEHWTQYYQ